MKMKTMLALFLAAACSVLSAEVPEIRYAAAAPFDAEGNRVESVWKKADTCVRFVTVKTSDVAIDQSEAQLLFDDKYLYASMTGFFDPKCERDGREDGCFVRIPGAKTGGGTGTLEAEIRFARIGEPGGRIGWRLLDDGGRVLASGGARRFAKDVQPQSGVFCRK